MGPAEQTTGTRDEHYNLISVLYHALHGAENCEIYMLDAEAAGKDELAAFFREAQSTQSRLAERAKGFLGIRSSVPIPGTSETGTEIPPEGMVEPEAPSRTEPSSIRPGTEEPRPRTEEAPPSRPEPSGDFPGTEPIREEAPPRTGEVPPTPEEVPPERAGEIPTAEEAPPPRAEEVPSGTPPQAPSEDVQRETKTSSRPEEASSRSADAEGGTNIPADEADATAEETPPMSNVPRVPQSTVPLPDEDLIAETEAVAPDAPAEGEDVARPAEAPRSEVLPPDSPREAPPPGEERPERRGEAPATDGTPREEPPPGEERPERQTPP
jgi:hypothetical protein